VWVVHQEHIPQEQEVRQEQEEYRQHPEVQEQAEVVMGVVMEEVAEVEH
jgi:hypothetical protein